MTVATVWNNIFMSTPNDMFSRYNRSYGSRYIIWSISVAYPYFTMPHDVIPGRT